MANNSCDYCAYYAYDEEYDCYFCDMNLDEDEIYDYFVENFKGDSLLAVGGDGDPIKIHYHTNEPWEVLKYCSTLGEIFDIVIEDMDRQSRGLKG